MGSLLAIVVIVGIGLYLKNAFLQEKNIIPMKQFGIFLFVSVAALASFSTSETIVDSLYTFIMFVSTGLFVNLVYRTVTEHEMVLYTLLYYQISIVALFITHWLNFMEDGILLAIGGVAFGQLVAFLILLIVGLIKRHYIFYESVKYICIADVLFTLSILFQPPTSLGDIVGGLIFMFVLHLPIVSLIWAIYVKRIVANGDTAIQHLRRVVFPLIGRQLVEEQHRE